jgi:hypothetical protein
MKNHQEFIIKLAIDSWHLQVKRADNLITLLTDEELQNEVSPQRNRGVYLLGHLTAVNDLMLPLFNIEQQLYPQLNEIFIHNPDKAISEIPTTTDLRHYWKMVNEKLSQHFEKLQAEEWLQKHSSISDDDFAKEPHRNKLSVLLNRTNHLSYHFGQLVLLKK